MDPESLHFLRFYPDQRIGTSEFCRGGGLGEHRTKCGNAPGFLWQRHCTMVSIFGSRTCQRKGQRQRSITLLPEAVENRRLHGDISENGNRVRKFRSRCIPDRHTRMINRRIFRRISYGIYVRFFTHFSSLHCASRYDERGHHRSSSR